MPFARATGMGSTLDCADHSNSVCFLVRSTISLPLMAAVTVAVVMGSSSGLRRSDAFVVLNEGTTKEAEKHEGTLLVFKTFLSALWPSVPLRFFSRYKIRSHPVPG